MHNHILTENPRIFPLPGKNSARPRFPTQGFQIFQLIKAGWLGEVAGLTCAGEMFWSQICASKWNLATGQLERLQEKTPEARINDARGRSPLSKWGHVSMQVPSSRTLPEQMYRKGSLSSKSSRLHTHDYVSRSMGGKANEGREKLPHSQVSIQAYIPQRPDPNGVPTR